MPECDIGNITLYYTDQGRGDVVLLLHGLGSCCEDWQPQVFALAEYYRVVAVDLRGHGKSSKPDQVYSVPLYARDIFSLMDKLEMSSIHLIGFSMGGMTAFQMAVDNPERINSLVVINAAPEMPNDKLWLRTLVTVRLLVVRLLGMGALGRMIGRKLFPKPEQHPLYQQFLRRMENNPKPVYIRALKSFVGWSVMDQLSSLTMPVHIVTADQDYTSVAYKQQYANKITGATLAVIKDSRHATPMDQPQQLNNEIIKFLNDRFTNNTAAVGG